MPKAPNKDLFSRFAEHIDIHQTSMYAEVMREIGWKVFGKPGSQTFLRTIGPVAVAKVQRPHELFLKEMLALRKQYRAMLFQVEAGLSMKIGKEILKFPKTFDSSANISNWKQQLRKTTGLRTFLSPLAHSATSLIDLKLSEKELLQNMHRMTRYNIGLAHRRNLIFKTIPLKNFTKQNEKDFFSILNEWSHRKNVYGFEEHLMRAIMRAFKKESWCHFVELNGKLISTLLMLKFGRVAVYYCAVSSKDGYAQKAPTALVWEGILAAKKAGCEILDFGGIYDPRYKDSYKRWTGFSKFKEGFSPTPFLYPPSVRYPVLWWINP